MATMEECGISGITITGRQITIVFADGDIKSVSKSDEALYNKVSAIIKEENYACIRSLVDIKDHINTYGGGRITVSNDVVLIDSEKLPEALSTKLFQFINSGLPIDYLVKFWDNLKKNPSYRSIQQLYSFLEKNNHPFTDDGMFIAYKKIRPNFKDIHSGTFDNSVGSVVQVNRNEVDEDPNKTCSYGLHVANYDYACNHFGTPQDILVLVIVNPADVVAIPTDYNESKMRVCKYKVSGVIERPLNTPVYKDTNDSMEDDYDSPDDELDDYNCNVGPCCAGCNCDGESCEDDFEKNPYSILDIEDPTDDEMIMAISSDPDILEDLINVYGNDYVSDRVKLAAINKKPTMIEFVDSPSDELKIAAVKLDPKTVSLF
jgi:hypothetical protein